MKITFAVPPFQIKVSSHGQYWIYTDDIPRCGPIIGTLEGGDIYPLNETWDPKGEEPFQLEVSDDTMPDVEDPRLKDCAIAYVERHRSALEATYDTAKKQWSDMQKVPMLVDGVPILPGTSVRVFYSKEGIREDAELRAETVFIAVGPHHDEGRPLLYFKDFCVGLSGGKYKWRHWIEPIPRNPSGVGIHWVIDSSS